jgi:vacuolar-type H+-ATPase subunit B/Vma2
MLPEDELIRIKEEHIRKYHPKYKTASSGA